MSFSDEYINGYKDGVLDALMHHTKIKLRQVSDTPYIPLEFNFPWDERHIYNNVFKQISEQGFKVTK